MKGPEQHGIWILGTSLRLSALVLAMVFVLAIVATPAAQAQTFKVIYDFPNYPGTVPMAGLAIDRAGNLYGTTRSGGDLNGFVCQLFYWIGCGTVFKLTKYDSGWLYSRLYEFHGADGAYPESPVTIAANGSLFGGTGLGGNCTYSVYGCGVLFELQPGAHAPKSAVYPWSETVLHVFTGNGDGGPYPSELIFDSAGNLYGTTAAGGVQGAGNIFQLQLYGGSWVVNNLYTFYGTSDGLYPHGVTFDSAGNLYGGTRQGGNTDCYPFQGCGTIFQLTPSQSGWTETVLHVFDQNTEGGGPGAVIFDQAGNMYGVTRGLVNPGIVWEMSPSNGGWTFTVLYRFTGYNDGGPDGRLTMDAAGNLYGVTNREGAYEDGTVFKLSPSNGGWTYTDLYDFQGGLDGCAPDGFVTVDASGNIFGTTSGCGANLVGTVWEITR
jgi:uncharacterized repeat protein (TIGR03803 family)